MAESKELIIKHDNKEIEISDLDYDKEVEIYISQEDEISLSIFLEVEDLMQIKAHIDYILNKAKN
jgi:hypothetical protein